MGNKNINGLTAATTPLVGIELIPVAQAGATDSVTVENLTRLRTVSVANLKTETTTNVAGAETKINLGLCPDLPTAGGTQITSRRTATSGAHHELAISTTKWGVMNESAVFDEDGNLKLKIAAKGIDFSANTHAAGMTSQLLNWYEEGTWTPVDNSGASLSFIGVTGTYVRIGKQVTAYFALTYPATVDGSNCQIGGLPFVAGNYGASGIVYSTVATLVRNEAYSGNSIMLLRDSAGTLMINSAMSGGVIRGGLTYTI